MIEIDKFIGQQLAQWPQAAQNFEALQGVVTKDIVTADGSVCKVQFNPARIVSTGAKVDAASLKKRPCFLCSANRPVQQIGIEWGEYTILVNPFPIFPRHLTIPLRAHQPQGIKGRISDMVELAKELPGYTVFYNGPKCGASAPDHMHFQAGNSDFLPLWQNLGKECLPPSIVLEQDIEETFDKLYDLLPVPEGEPEPMMNILCRAVGDKVQMVVIPRKRHRPSFYGDGDGQMLVSPASVDLSGILITPLGKDFEKIDAEDLVKLYAELCYSKQEIKNLKEKLFK